MKKILAGLLLTTAMCNIGFAEAVIVTGTGINRDAAINDAKRNAVEKVVGTYVSSSTQVASSSVLKDEIYSKSYGFVKDIQILQETQGAVYEVKARVDVDDSPNSQLMNQLESVRVLNNPRISVVVNHNTTGTKSAKYMSLCETIITDKLREMGFTKIVDKAKVWQKKNEGRGGVVISKSGISKTSDQKKSDNKNVSNSNMKPSYNTRSDTQYKAYPKQQPKPEIPKPGFIDYALYLPNSDTDYFIFGSLEFITSKVMHPVFKDMREEKVSNFDTGFQKTTATLEIKILKSDTMEQIGIHSVDAASMHSDINVAERDAVQKVANKAAIKIAESFAKNTAAIDNGFEFQVRTEHDNLEKFLVEVKKVTGVRNVRLRNYQNGKASYEIDGDIRSYDLFRALQQSSRFRITKVNMSDNLLEIIVA